jgi:pseudouridine-5'-monophosphatase
MIRHVVFDLDGTLLDTEELYSEAAQRVVGRYGKTYTRELKHKTMGGDTLRGAQLVVDTLELPITAEEYVKAREDELYALFENVSPMAGAEKLVAQLTERGVPFAVATSGHRELTIHKLSKQRFLRDVSVVVCGDDPRLEDPKPAPDIFLLAAGELGVDPEDCCAVEDSHNGVLAALSAGMRTIALADPRFGLDLCGIEGVARCVGSLDELSVTDLGIA